MDLESARKPEKQTLPRHRVQAPFFTVLLVFLLFTGRVVPYSHRRKAGVLDPSPHPRKAGQWRNGGAALIILHWRPDAADIPDHLMKDEVRQ
jgi:hypothetical protein